jgi:CheY-like chemotaxis protein
MDVEMPVMDGLEASRAIHREWPGSGRPRIVAMTANALQGDREKALAAGMADYIAKPVKAEYLEALLALDPALRRESVGRKPSRARERSHRFFPPRHRLRCDP